MSAQAYFSQPDDGMSLVMSPNSQSEEQERKQHGFEADGMMGAEQRRRMEEQASINKRDAKLIELERKTSFARVLALEEAERARRVAYDGLKSPTSIETREKELRTKNQKFAFGQTAVEQNRRISDYAEEALKCKREEETERRLAKERVIREEEEERQRRISEWDVQRSEQDLRDEAKANKKIQDDAIREMEIERKRRISIQKHQLGKPQHLQPLQPPCMAPMSPRSPLTPF